ncbi:MAG: prolipoprotein diacylglyceryl transferase, partial [Candidatus Riflebacteria bacterium]|nr:prolipoprotein diacylglyceryl transferase [Candidatus Riflebacteria bacterium]
MQCPAGLQFPYYIYGVLMLAAFSGGILLFYANCRALKKPVPDSIDMFLLVSISGVAGARAAYILLFPDQFTSIRDYFALHEGGLVFYGGLIAAVATL